jgi:pilus assembly protein TadC
LSSALLISITFGLGVSGLVYNLFGSRRIGLASRISLITTATQNKTRASNVQYIFERLGRKIQSKSLQKISQALFELPEVLDLLIVSLRSGEGIYQSLQMVVPRARGELASELSRCLTAVNYGAALTDEIRKIPNALAHPQFAELANKIVMSLVRGTPLAKMLEDQASSARSEIRNQLLRQAGKNETRMLVPLVFLILPVIVLFAMYPSLKLLNFSFI